MIDTQQVNKGSLNPGVKLGNFIRTAPAKLNPCHYLIICNDQKKLYFLHFFFF